MGLIWLTVLCFQLIQYSISQQDCILTGQNVCPSVLESFDFLGNSPKNLKKRDAERTQVWSDLGNLFNLLSIPLFGSSANTVSMSQTCDEHACVCSYKNTTANHNTTQRSSTLIISQCCLGYELEYHQCIKSQKGGIPTLTKALTDLSIDVGRSSKLQDMISPYANSTIIIAGNNENDKIPSEIYEEDNNDNRGGINSNEISNNNNNNREPILSRNQNRNRRQAQVSPSDETIKIDLGAGKIVGAVPPVNYSISAIDSSNAGLIVIPNVILPIGSALNDHTIRTREGKIFHFDRAETRFDEEPVYRINCKPLDKINRAFDRGLIHTISSKHANGNGKTENVPILPQSSHLTMAQALDRTVLEASYKKFIQILKDSKVLDQIDQLENKGQLFTLTVLSDDTLAKFPVDFQTRLQQNDVCALNFVRDLLVPSVSCDKNAVNLPVTEHILTSNGIIQFVHYTNNINQLQQLVSTKIFEVPARYYDVKDILNKNNQTIIFAKIYAQAQNLSTNSTSLSQLTYIVPTDEAFKSLDSAELSKLQNNAEEAKAFIGKYIVNNFNGTTLSGQPIYRLYQQPLCIRRKAIQNNICGCKSIVYVQDLLPQPLLNTSSQKTYKLDDIHDVLTKAIGSRKDQPQNISINNFIRLLQTPVTGPKYIKRILNSNPDSRHFLTVSIPTDTILTSAEVNKLLRHEPTISPDNRQINGVKSKRDSLNGSKTNNTSYNDSLPFDERFESETINDSDEDEADTDRWIFFNFIPRPYPENVDTYLSRHFKTGLQCPDSQSTIKLLLTPNVMVNILKDNDISSDAPSFFFSLF